MNGADFLAELDAEAPATRRLLERVPGEHLGWRPGPKAMTLGQLALHVATIPGGIARAARGNEFDVGVADGERPSPSSAGELVPTLEASLNDARAFLRDLDPAAAAAPWRLLYKGRELFGIPKAGVVRTLLLNHWYHHRGQLVVYFRSLDVPVPAVYGRSADEMPF